MGIEPTTSRFCSHTSCRCAMTGLIFFFYFLYGIYHLVNTVIIITLLQCHTVRIIIPDCNRDGRWFKLRHTEGFVRNRTECCSKNFWLLSLLYIREKIFIKKRNATPLFMQKLVIRINPQTIYILKRIEKFFVTFLIYSKLKYYIWLKGSKYLYKNNIKCYTIIYAFIKLS